MATHSSILAWRNPWTEETGRLQFSSVQLLSHVSLPPHGPQHARPPCPSPTPRVYSNSYPLSRWCHPTSSSCVIPFSSRLQSFPASGSFQLSQFFASVGQSIGVSASASVLPMNIQDWFTEIKYLKQIIWLLSIRLGALSWPFMIISSVTLDKSYIPFKATHLFLKWVW